MCIRDRVTTVDRIDSIPQPLQQQDSDENNNEFFNWKRNRYSEDTYGDRYVEKKRFHKNSWSIRGLNGHINLRDEGEGVDRKNNSYQVRLLMQSSDVSDDCDTYYDSNTGTRRYTHSLAYSLTHWLTYSLTHLLTHSLTHSLTYSLTHSLTYSLPY